MDLGLKERVVLVTGSSQGIGRATAELFGREGARVAVTYRNHREKAEAVAESIRRSGGEAMVVPFDLQSDESIRAATQEVLARWGRVDVLVNNAVKWGSRMPTDMPAFEQFPVEEWRDALRTNVEGVFLTIQQVLPSMRRQRWGRIVTISSGLAVHGIPGSGAYSAAKSALHGLTRSLFRELGPEGILVNVVMAGLTLTEHARERLPEAVIERMAQASPIRRLPGPEEVAPTIVFLASAVNTTVNGELILSSGGHA